MYSLIARKVYGFLPSTGIEKYTKAKIKNFAIMMKPKKVSLLNPIVLGPQDVGLHECCH